MNTNIIENTELSNSYLEFAKKTMEEFYNKNGRVPQKKEMASEISVDYLINTFGSWGNTLKSFGLKKETSCADALVSLRNLRDEINTVPSIKLVKEKNIDISGLIESYGSWGEVKKLLREGFATIKPSNKRKNELSESELLELKNELSTKIVELANSLGRIPKISELKGEKISVVRINKLFGSWNDAKEELKLEDIERNNLTEELKSIQESSLDKVLSSDLKDYDIPYSRIKKIFGSWKKAYNEVGLSSVRAEVVKKEVVELTNSLQRTPSFKEIREHKIPMSFLTKNTPWRELKKSWELDKISNSFIIDQIITLSKNIDYTPTVKELKENNIKTSKLFKFYGGWNNTRKAIGLPKHSKYSNSYIDEMEVQLLDLATSLGKTPTYTVAQDEDINVFALKARHGSWNNVLFNLGLKLNTNYTDEAIAKLGENIKALAESLGKTPTLNELKENGIAISPLRRKYGSMEQCFDALGLTPNTQTDKTYNREKILDTLKSLCLKLGKAPSAKRAKEEGIKTNKLIKDIGSWKAIKNMIKEAVASNNVVAEAV